MEGGLENDDQGAGPHRHVQSRQFLRPASDQQLDSGYSPSPRPETISRLPT